MSNKLYRNLTVDQIAQIIYLAESGWSIVEISQSLKVSKPSIRSLIDEIKKEECDE